MNNPTYIGIDPGVSRHAPGAIALLGVCTQVIDIPIRVEAVKSRKNKVGIGHRCHLDRDAMWQLVKGWSNCVVAIEQQIIYGHDGRGSGATTMLNYGMIIGMLIAKGIPYIEVPPRIWQGNYGLDGDKDTHIALAQRRFPTATDKLTLKKHHGRADALLIARFAMECAAVAAIVEGGGKHAQL